MKVIATVGKNYFFANYFFVIIPFIALALGCQSKGIQPINPFAMDRQTIPAPATYSYQQSLLGQGPSTYQPSAPATTYPGSTPPSQSNPAPMYPNTPPSGDILFQNTQPSTSISDTPTVVAIPISEMTSQTAAENLDNRAALSMVISPNGQAGYTYLGQAPVVSSSQVVTTVSD